MHNSRSAVTEVQAEIERLALFVREQTITQMADFFAAGNEATHSNQEIADLIRDFKGRL